MFNYYINEIIKNKTGDCFYSGRKSIEVGGYIVSFWLGDNNEYLDGLQYVQKGEFLWTWSTPKEFYLKYINEKKLIFKEYSIQFYGQKKIAKPKELKGIKQSFSVDYILNKTKCPVFIKGKDVWINHNDYFSSTMNLNPEDMDKDLSYIAKKYLDKNISSKFTYSDNWGSIVLRNRAWLILEDIITRIELGDSNLEILNTILRQQENSRGFDQFELEVGDMSRFFESLITNLRKNIL